MAARLEHERCAYPVELRSKVHAAFGHRRSVKLGATTGDHADGVPARMGIDAEESMPCHGRLCVYPSIVMRMNSSR